MTTKPGEEGSAAPAEKTLKHQTWFLKVPIHCEGCKKKVKRIVQTIDGVSMVDVDSRLHKVTVTGHVDAETVVGKLVRSGKQAELWPEENPKKKKNSKDETEEKGKENGESKDNNDDGDGGNSLSEGEEHGDGGGGSSGGGKKKKNKKKKGGQSNDTKNGGGQVIFTGIPSTFGPEQASMVPPSMRPIPQDRYFNAYLPVQNPPLMATNEMSYQPTDDTTNYASSEPDLPPPSLETIVIYSDDYDQQDEYYEDGGCSIM